MAGHCMLVNLGDQAMSPARQQAPSTACCRCSARTHFGHRQPRRRAATRSAASSPLPIGSDSADQRLLDSLLGPDSATLDTRNASLIGQVNLGTQSWVSIGGTLARVRLIPTEQLRGGLPPEWNAGSLSLAAAAAISAARSPAR